ncbi:MAG: SDR family NAD(P)-dependent oxidoreductase [Limnohabitans sp.]
MNSPALPSGVLARVPGVPAPHLSRRRWPQLNVPLRDWVGRRVWLVGASTGIGLACAKALHAAGAQVIISARKPQTVQDWAAREEGVRWLALDVTDAQAVRSAAQSVLAEGALDLVIYCAGHYRAQRAAQWSLAEMLRHEQVNYTGALHVLDAVLPALISQGQGHISLVSSVAGWRGLPNGLAYGPTKAALTHLGESLYMDLQDHGVDVSVIHPGFVATPLTAQNQFSMPALMRPEAAAAAMLRGWARGQFDIHFPKRFTGVLKLLRLLPYAVYFPLVRRMTGL